MIEPRASGAPASSQKIDRARTLARVRSLARFMDDAIPIPGTNFRIGFDPLLGLLPGLGDALGLGISMTIIVSAYRLDVPANILAKMLANVSLEAVGGAVPVIGDLFDAGWKANVRNTKLLEDHVERSEAADARARFLDLWKRRGLVLAAGLIGLGGIVLTAYILWALGAALLGT